MKVLFHTATAIFGVLALACLWGATRVLGNQPALIRFLTAGVGFAFVAVLWEVQRRVFAGRDYVLRNDGTSLLVWCLMLAVVGLVGVVFALVK